MCQSYKLSGHQGNRVCSALNSSLRRSHSTVCKVEEPLLCHLCSMSHEKAFFICVLWLSVLGLSSRADNTGPPPPPCTLISAPGTQHPQGPYTNRSFGNFTPPVYQKTLHPHFWDGPRQDTWLQGDLASWQSGSMLAKGVSAERLIRRSDCVEQRRGWDVGKVQTANVRASTTIAGCWGEGRKV